MALRWWWWNFVVVLYYSCQVAAWINYPADSTATLTHYTLPLNYVAACGCTAASTHYPTAALSQMAYGSSNAYGSTYSTRCPTNTSYPHKKTGPACGSCFNLTLVNPVIASPPFYPSVTKFIVVKVTDLCPLSETGYCNATDSRPNGCVPSYLTTLHMPITSLRAGAYLNFDLAYPSSAIPDNFFPSDQALYGYTACL